MTTVDSDSAIQDRRDEASIRFGTGLTDMAPGAADGLYLIVDDIIGVPQPDSVDRPERGPWDRGRRHGGSRSARAIVRAREPRGDSLVGSVAPRVT